MPELLQNPYVQVVSVCDPNTLSTDYLDWSPYGIRNSLRKTLDDPTWGESYKGIPGGRVVGKQVVEQYYAKHQASGT